MTRKHFKIILSICIPSFLFQTSTQFPFSVEQSDESSISDEHQSVSIIKELKSNQKNILDKHFVNHLMAITQLEDDELKIERNMFNDMKKMIQYEANPIFSIKSFREIIKNGTEALDSIVEKKKNNTSFGNSGNMRYQNSIWIKVESNQQDEAKSVLENINRLLNSLENHLGDGVSVHLKIFEGIKQMIDDRKKKIHEESVFIRKYLKKVNESKTSKIGTTLPADSTYPAVLFDKEDVKMIQALYEEILRVVQLDLPECKNLLKTVKKAKVALPLFCKYHAEVNVIMKKAEQCIQKGDDPSLNVFLRTLQQPNYKKYFEILVDSRAPSPDSI